MKETSWESSYEWYDSIVGEKGHYYHQKIVLPGVLKLLDLQSKHNLLDLGCGQGVLSRHIPKDVSYVGVDLSASLIQLAKKNTSFPFYVGDMTQPIEKLENSFTHAIIVLAIQNVENVEAVFQNVARYLKPKGHFIMVLNHPCFRIPRQSSWGIDPKQKKQYRRVDLYMESLKIPIQTHPSQGKQSETTWSFHRPLSSYTHLLSQSGFLIEKLEEWVSDKISTGARAKMENRSRKNFPLFLALKAVKSS